MNPEKSIAVKIMMVTARNFALIASVALVNSPFFLWFALLIIGLNSVQVMDLCWRIKACQASPGEG